MDFRLRSLTLEEIDFLALLPSFSSLRALARARDMEPARVSRILQRLEQVLGQNLVERAPGGIHVTPEGLRVAAVARELVDGCSSLSSASVIQTRETVLNFGTRTFLNVVFAPALAELCARNFKHTRLRFLDMSPDELKVAEHRRTLHLAIYLDEMEWTSAWITREVGTMTWAPFVRNSHPLAQKQQVTLEDLRQSAFVAPAYWLGNEVRPGEDGFPIPINSRMLGMECQNALVAVQVAAVTDSVAFLPRIVAQPLVRTGQLRRLHLEDSVERQQKVYLAVRSDAVSKKLMESLILGAKEALMIP